MAAVGAEVAGSWFLSSGPVGFFILLLLLSIFLTALCSDCKRHSFELQDSEVDRNPSSLIRVVKLEDALGARENPMINEIQSDEENSVSVTAWRSHLGAPHIHQDVQTNGSAAVMTTTSESDSAAEENPFPPWRSHLEAPQSSDLNGSAPPDSDHIYHVIGGGRSSGDADVSSPPTNQEPREERSGGSAVAVDRNSMYARVSKKKASTPPAQTPEEVQAEEEEEEEEEEEASPPLPDKNTQLEG